MSNSLRYNHFIQNLAAMQASTEANMKYAGLPRGTLRGTIVDVDDPKNRGRVRVIFDDMNPDIPQVSGAGDWSKERVGGKPDKSHWIDMSPAFEGNNQGELLVNESTSPRQTDSINMPWVKTKFSTDTCWQRASRKNSRCPTTRR